MPIEPLRPPIDMSDTPVARRIFREDDVPARDENDARPLRRRAPLEARPLDTGGEEEERRPRAPLEVENPLRAQDNNQTTPTPQPLNPEAGSINLTA